MSKEYIPTGTSSIAAGPDPWQNLAVAIVYSGFSDKDEDFFKSEWAAHLMEYIGIFSSPLSWYRRYRRQYDKEVKHNGRRSR